MEILIQTILISLIAAFTICLLRKLGIIEMVQVHGNDFFARLASCDFCLSWWANVIISIIAAIILEDLHILVTPFLGTMITRHLL